MEQKTLEGFRIQSHTIEGAELKTASAFHITLKFCFHHFVCPEYPEKNLHLEIICTLFDLKLYEICFLCLLGNIRLCGSGSPVR